MPINIYNSENGNKVTWLSDDSWELPTQIDDLQEWLVEIESSLMPGEYVADIGFDIRKDAFAGGAVLSSKSMAIMGKLGIQIFFSEYPSGDDE